MKDNIFNFRLIKPNLRLIGPPLLVILLLIILAIVAIPIAYTHATQGIKSLREAEVMENQLNTKLSSLQQVRNDVLPNSNAVLLAFPDKNPATARLSHLRADALSTQTTSINGISSQIVQRSNDDQDIKNMDIDVEYTTSSMQDMINLVKNLETTSPLTTLKKFTIENIDPQQEQMAVMVTYNVYWSQLPSTLTKISEPVKELTSDEMDLLNRLVELRLPQFTNLEKTENSERSDPFN